MENHTPPLAKHFIILFEKLIQLKTIYLQTIGPSLEHVKKEVGDFRGGYIIIDDYINGENRILIFKNFIIQLETFDYSNIEKTFYFLNDMALNFSSYRGLYDYLVSEEERLRLKIK